MEGSLQTVRITSAASSHPSFRFPTSDAAEIAGQLGLDPRKIGVLAKNSHIEHRAVSFPVERLPSLGSIATRNDIYRRLAPPLAVEAAGLAVGEIDPTAFGCLVTTSCTGYSIPGWGLDIIEKLNLPRTIARMPVTEAGCAGGAVAITWASHFARSGKCEAALAVSTELCSLTFHAPFEEDNMLASLLFGDGAGAAVIETGPGPGLEILDTLSYLVPNSRHALGFDLTDVGFTTILSRQLADIIEPHFGPAIRQLLSRNSLEPRDIDAWLIHPGGPRILETVEADLGSRRDQMRWSWESMAEWGNTSSASVFDVLHRYMKDQQGRPQRAVLAAFGPGVAIELLLLESH